VSDRDSLADDFVVSSALLESVRSVITIHYELLTVGINWEYRTVSTMDNSYCL